MNRVAFCTLGCKVNQYETHVMTNLFKDAGYEVVDFDNIADIYIVNTCTVTNIGERKSRQMLRRAKEINPDSILCVVGCYAQVAKDELSKIENIDILLGNNEKKDVVKYVENFISTRKTTRDVKDIMKKMKYEEWGDICCTNRHKAEIKIQDGCDRFCSYCIIPYARGPVRSRNIDDICTEAKKLVEQGMKDIIITGIHISSYGKDLKENLTLIDVLGKLNEINGIESIELGSLEPRIITEEFVEEINKLNKVKRHFHLSLQSACNETLMRMNRKYSIEEFIEKVELIRKYFPEVELSTDIIVGFPGETEEEFNITLDNLKKINFNKIHVFKYSPRKGTPAAKYENQVKGEIKKKRSEMISDLTIKK